MGIHFLELAFFSEISDWPMELEVESAFGYWGIACYVLSIRSHSPSRFCAASASNSPMVGKWDTVEMAQVDLGARERFHSTAC